jgi:hypothetical protein
LLISRSLKNGFGVRVPGLPPNNMKNFYLDTAHFESVTIHRKWNIYAERKNPTADDIVSILQGKGDCSTIHNEDHPEFAKLRNQLEKEGFIHTQRTWSNGDSVLKPFYLNGAKFKLHDKFPCAAAMKYEVDHKLQREEPF